MNTLHHLQITLIGCVILLLNTSVFPAIAGINHPSVTPLDSRSNPSVVDRHEACASEIHTQESVLASDGVSDDPGFEVVIRGGYCLSLKIFANDTVTWEYWINLSFPLWSRVFPDHPFFYNHNKGKGGILHAQMAGFRFCFGTFSVELNIAGTRKTASGIVFSCTLLCRGYIILERNG